MTLALRLGRTLHELKETLTASELRMWIEYDRVNPISDRRGDIQSAQVVTAVLNSQGAKVKMEDVLLQWREPDPVEESGGLENFFAALSG
ncbi:phage tail assembly protein T [Erwinia sp. CGal63]|uniref:phage tail assembly protein T n=1 Tax=Erwinia sp. CGal63 TaxID=2919889 RepID=UPI003008AB48